MTKKTNPLEELRQTNPFKVPEGYFDNLSDQILSQLPDKVSEPTKTLTLWDRVKPWTYMAAMFVGIALMVKIFVGPSAGQSNGLNLTSETEIEAFYEYYEDQMASVLYREAVLLDEFEEY